MIGASALQSAHQCAQKNSSTGDPFSCAGSGSFAPRNCVRLQRRRHLPLQRQQVQILLQAGREWMCSHTSAARTAAARPPASAARAPPGPATSTSSAAPNAIGRCGSASSGRFFSCSSAMRLRLLRISRRLVVLACVERGPPHPRIGFQILGGHSLLVAIRIQRRLRGRKTVLHQGDAHVVDNPRPRRSREQNRNQQNSQTHV